MLFRGFVFQDFRLGELARGGWGNQEKRELVEPGVMALWTLHINLNSKKPLKQSSVREMSVICTTKSATYST